MAKKLSQMSPAARAKRVASLVANPATRSAVPDKYLPSSMLAQRQENKRLDSPVVQGSSLTYRQAGQQRDANANLKYGDAEQAINTQIAGSQGVQRAIPQWYQTYKSQLAQNQANSAAVYGAAGQQIAGLQSAVAGQTMAPETAQLQQQAAALGAPAGAQDAAAQTAGQAAAVRAALAGNQGALLATQGANQNAYQGGLIGAAGQGQIEQMLQEVQKQRDLQTSQASLQKEKSSYKVSEMAAIKDAEQKSVLENAAFNLNAANTASDNTRADESLQLQKTTAQQRSQTAASSGDHYGYTNAEWAKLGPAARTKAAKAWKQGTSVKGGGRAGTATPAQTSSAVSSLQKALSSAENAVKGNVPRSKAGQAILGGVPAATKIDQDAYDRAYAKALKQNPDKVRARTIAKQQATQKYSATPKVANPVLVSAALDIAYNGHLSPPTQQRLQRAGYSVKEVLKQLGKGKTAGEYNAAQKARMVAGRRSQGPNY